MTDVFISYKKEDVDRVKPIAEGLAAAGYDVWWDHRIPPGRTYREIIGAALQSAKCVMVIWSENSTKSQWVLDEADVGAQRRVLLPVLLDNIMPPLGFTQIEASRLIGWDGDTSNLEWQHTVEAVGQLVGRAPGEAPPVQISMPSSGGAGDSPAMLRATPGALSDMAEAVPSKTAAKNKGGGAGLLIAGLCALAAIAGGGYFAFANGLFSGSLPPSDGTPEAVQSASVRLHLSAERQADLGDQIRQALEAASHSVRDEVRVEGDRSPRSGNQVRYFNDNDDLLAEGVATRLSALAGVEAFDVKHIPELAEIEAAGAIEVWLAYVEDEISTPPPPTTTDPDPVPPPSQPASRFGNVTGQNVRSVTVPDGSVFGILPDGRWAHKHRAGELMGTFRETNRDDWSVFMRNSNTNDPIQIDLFMGTVFTDPYTNKQPLYTISSASTEGIAMPEARGFPGVNGETINSATLSSGQQLAALKDGFWGLMGSSGLPTETFTETGRDEWSVYLERVSDGAPFMVDSYTKQFDSLANQTQTNVAGIRDAANSGARVPQIAEASAFLFGPELEFERISSGVQPRWQEIDLNTGERRYIWTEVARDGHFMELTDDGRGARMRVDLIQAQVYLSFPDWGGFQPQWKVTDMR
ncbi:MAG: toll/interleukin-1 receptor domain-containing protein [Pseudomonadota bacterium]